MESSKQIHAVVLDAGPLLLNQPPISTLLNKCEQIFTTPAVLAEIRDESARQRVENMVKPFLHIRTPTPGSVKVVSDFSRKTGDFAVLSNTDLQIFALAYELECERNGGDWRLRNYPGQKRLNGSPPQVSDPSKEDIGVESQVLGMKQAAGRTEASNEAAIESSINSDALLPPQPKEKTVEGTGSLEEFSSRILSSEADFSKLNIDTAHEEGGPKMSERGLSPDQDELEGPQQNNASDSDSEGWITPSNLGIHQREAELAANGGGGAAQAVLQVATVTADFALQNSLLLMNLNLLSSSLRRISHLRSHILRCHACFATTKEMTRQFCHRCGMPTLTKVSCSSTSSGGFQLHLKKNKQWNTRGDRYSIPKPVAGTSSGKTGSGGRGKGGKGGWGKELLLAEDQKEYTRAFNEQQRKKGKNLMDEDYLPAILTGEREGNGKIRVGAGRNVNSRKR